MKLVIQKGNTGAQGIQGASGGAAQGATGLQGVQGIIGVQGYSGVNGSDGSQGAVGAQGAEGQTGYGLQGSTGAQGTTGAGTQGVQGIQGDLGIQGTTGAGTQGATGAGTQGVQGAQGVQGLDGLYAAQGIQGTTGSNGANGLGYTTNTITDSVNLDAALSVGSVLITCDELAYTGGEYVKLFYDADHYLEGWISPYSAGQYDILPVRVVGAGTYAAWTLTLAGVAGTQLIATCQDTYDLSTLSGAQTINPDSSLFGFTAGQTILVLNDTSNYWEGTITSVTGSQIYADVDRVVGSTTQSTWTITLQGKFGVQGATGAGTQGADGAQGATGTQGVDGAQGTTGAGTQGADGAQGATGTQGADGAQGTTGAGTQGATGTQGSTGTQGVQGLTGAGTQGVQGASGAGGRPAGSNTQVQFNDDGAFGASANLTFNKATNTLRANVFLAANGTNAAPAYTFASYSNTGLYMDDAGDICWSDEGRKAFVVYGEPTAVNWVYTAGWATGSPSEIGTDGTDTNIPLNVMAKGDASVRLKTLKSAAYRTLFQADPAATITGVQNYVNVYSNNPSSPPSVEAEGGDTNIDLDLWGKGTGSIRFNGANAAVNSAGWFTANSFAVGYLDIPQNANTSSNTLTITDRGKHIYHASGAGAGDTYTIPANASVAYPIGTAIMFVNMDTNAVSIAITSDTMYLAGTGSTGTRTLAQYGVATALKLTSTTWIISGSGLT